MSDDYSEASYGARPVGWGRKPAVLVVDFQVAFTRPEYPLGRSEHIHEAVEKTSELLKIARKCGVPVASCYTAYHSQRDIPYWKIDAVHDHFYYGHPSTAMDERIAEPDYDYIFCKSAPSIFFQTPVTTFLAKQGVDTVVLTGCTTSGCVRASAIDSFSYGYRTIVAEDCSGDIEEGPHRDNLRDIGRRYVDVMPSAEVVKAFEDYRKRND
ncbi:isochorismatase family protein [Marinibaculum pumilum]|uniref:Isochorismatase family protein n=1 Tax=Marinibaculum pumilum TaxID=1766165 RepID=A0ABV7L5K7_9PROT